MSGAAAGRLLSGKVLTPTGLVERGVIAVEGDTIRYAGPAEDLPEAYVSWPEETGGPEAGEALLLPGFVDVHVHGGAGHDFMDASRQAMLDITRFHLSHGTTTMLATTMTAPRPAIEAVLNETDRFRAEGMPYARLGGVHLEGPFISPKWSGAQNPEHIVDPSVSWMEDWERRYPGLIRQVTLAPERDGATALIVWLRARGITAALGHTDATYEQVSAAADAGLNQAVHTFNAMTPLHHRKPGAAGAVMSDSRIGAEIIADGVHVHPAALSLLARLKGQDRLLLITDAMPAAGLADGAYRLGDLPVTVRDGIATLTDNPEALAGSTLTMDRGFKYLVREVGLSLEDASRAASLNPARSIGQAHAIGSLEAGKKADIVMMNEDLNLTNVWIGGRRFAD